MTGEHFTADKVAKKLNAAPWINGRRAASFVLLSGESIDEDFTRYPEPRTYTGPGVLEVVEWLDGGVDVMWTVKTMEKGRKG